MEDNQSAIIISADEFFRIKARHYQARLGFIRDRVKHGEVKLIPVKSQENRADGFTKNLHSAKTFTIWAKRVFGEE